MLSFAVLALTSLAYSANALAIPRSDTFIVPASYDSHYLEPYESYHKRYMALDCEGKHNSSFFDHCCHPMLATENLKDNRPPYCNPYASVSSSAAQTDSTSAAQPSGDPDCNDDQSSSTADPASTSASPLPSSTAAPAPPANVALPPDPSPSPSPSPSSSAQPQPSPSSSPAPAPPSSGGNNAGLDGIMGSVMSGGISTYFLQNGIAGNCGQVHQDSDSIVALQTNTYANGEHCGKTIKIMDIDTGHVEYAVVADSCPTCNSPESIDLSQGLFEKFASTSQGTFNVIWGFTTN